MALTGTYTTDQQATLRDSQVDPQKTAIAVNIEADDSGLLQDIVDAVGGGGGGTSYALTVDNALESTAYDLNNAAYSATSSITNDYILSHIQFNFSTTESRDITVTLSDGTILWSASSDTSLDIILEDIDKAFDGGDNFTIEITQTSGACLVDVLATIKTTDTTITTSSIGGVDSNNSSTVPLNDGQTFTGDWTDVSKYPSYTVSVKTDQTGVLYVDYSPDGSNVDSTLTYDISASINEIHRLTNGKQYARVRVENDSGSNQTYMRLQSLYGHQTQISAPVSLLAGLDADASIVRPTDYRYEVARSKWQNSETWNKFGYNLDIDTGAERTMWAANGAHSILTSASTLEITSTDVNDDGSPASTGAQTMRITGIDANKDILIEDVTLNGTVGVTTTGQFLGINRAQVTSSGSSNSNEGDITIAATSDASIQAFVPTGESVTQQCIFFVPANYTFLADWLSINFLKLSGSSPKVTIKGYVYNYNTSTRYEIFRTSMDTDVDNHLEFRPSQPFPVLSENVLYFTASTTNDGTEGNIRFSGVLVRDS